MAIENHNKKLSVADNTNFLGPVTDMEKFVDPDWWRYIFNSNYLKTDADIVDDSSITAHEVDMYIEYAGLMQNHKILDLCCGQGRHMLELKKTRI